MINNNFIYKLKFIIKEKVWKNKRMQFINKIYYISKESQDNITLWMNHLLVVYAFLIPISIKARSSVFFCILLLFLYRRNFVHYFKIAFKIDILKYFILLYIVLLIGMLYTDDISHGSAFMHRARALLFPLLFLSFLDVRFSFRVLNAFIIGVLFSEVVSYLIHFQIIPPELFIDKYKVYQTILEDPAPFLNHIKHNIALAIVISILIYNLLVKDIENLYLKILSMFFITTAFINMSLIGGRTGYIVLLVLIFLVVCLVYKKGLKKIVFISLSIVFVMFMYMYNFSEQFNTRIEDAKDDIEKMIEQRNYNSSIGLRVLATYYAIEVIKDNFLVGVGTGDVMQEIIKLAKNEHPYIAILKKPHNVYLEVFAQIGVIGFFIMMLMFYKILKYKTLDKKKDDIIKIVVVASLIFMIPGNFFGFFELSMFTAIISAMACKYKFDNINIKEIDKEVILRYFLVIIIFLIIGITK